MIVRALRWIDFKLPMANSLSTKAALLTVALILVGLTVLAAAQTPSSALPGARGVLRLRVRVRVGDKTGGLSRKRFFLIKGTREENKALVKGIEQQAVLSRDCYYRGIGASENLIKWLRESDCESIYCREAQAKDLEGSDAVPEFQQAVAVGEKEFRSRDLAIKWLAVNLPETIRSGFYKNQQQALQTFVKQAEEISRSKVMSVMTDTNGTAFFTDLEPGTYVISNILATEVGGNATYWNCEVNVKPGDLSEVRPWLIANAANKEKRVECVAVEKPLPVCP